MQTPAYHPKFQAFIDEGVRQLHDALLSRGARGLKEELRLIIIDYARWWNENSIDKYLKARK
jgi:hypothetical protein